MIDFPVAADEVAELDPESIANDLGPSGAIARTMRLYGDRPAQREMARTIASLYNDTGVGLIEASTSSMRGRGETVYVQRQDNRR